MPHVHVIISANQDRPVFSEPEIIRDTFIAFERVASEGATISAYALMSAHAHLLLGAEDPAEVGSVMARILAPLARNINGRLKQHGGVFRHPYWRGVVRSASHLYILPLYIHANPSPHATTLARLDVGLRSSHAAWMSGDAPDFLRPRAALDQYAGDYPAAMQAFLDDRAAAPVAGALAEGPEQYTILAVARATGTRPATLLDSARGGKRDRMLLAWALGEEFGNAAAARILGVERHTIGRWARAVAVDDTFGPSRARLGPA